MRMVHPERKNPFLFLNIVLNIELFHECIGCYPFGHMLMRFILRVCFVKD
ncbi:hypothetical protein CLOBOL_00405 [Enterocloster bolteae ATCC BAA-613]|uniref:Uncharacterized protein n=1 Tax=Enterocloster bolteae (strain ATCC BAA-613 / DSM 15670 / CCUG 46953 / JCM 12243 / WAL 16351) TaxID=411902 RepID=A8RHF8_ENTBW|nr:hypothetical protein CLOBOL_00405 [Enterocloster bolteae ATCC BAA-613]